MSGRYQRAITLTGETPGALDKVATWLKLETVATVDSRGRAMWLRGVPCRRRLIREAVTRQVWAEDDEAGDEAVWGAQPSAARGSSVLREIEIQAAQYEYAVPRVLDAILYVEVAQRAYLRFRAAELDAEYRLLVDKDIAAWTEHVMAMLQAGWVR